MSDSDVKSQSHNTHNSIRKLNSPNEELNWDNWSFAMRMILRGKNLEYVVEGGFKEGFNGTSTVLTDAVSRADNRLVSSIITSRVHEDNYVTIAPFQDSARRMRRALAASHQNTTAGGRYIHLRSMMTQRATCDDDVSKLIITMDSLRQCLLNACPYGSVSVNDLYISSLISALPDEWTVTAPLELQTVITPMELKSVLRGHMTKLKNRETTTTESSLTALLTTLSSKKGRSTGSGPRLECPYCKMKGHQADVCHQKLLDNQRKGIDALKLSLKSPRSSKSAKVAVILDSELESSDHATPVAKLATKATGCVKFSRAARKTSPSSSHPFVYNADTGCTDTLVASDVSLKHSSSIQPTLIFMADDTSIEATAVGPIHPPIAIP